MNLVNQNKYQVHVLEFQGTALLTYLVAFVHLSASPVLISDPVVNQMAPGIRIQPVKVMLGKLKMDVTLAQVHLADQETGLQRQVQEEDQDRQLEREKQVEIR